jgi:MFS family permease
VAKENTPQPHDPFAALRFREFSFYVSARFFLTLGIQMQSVIVGWQVYSLTKDVLMLGYSQLAEFLPFLIISFFSGHFVDLNSRKRVIILFSVCLLLVTGSLAWFSTDASGMLHRFGITPIFFMVACSGAVRAFLGPAFPAWLAQIIPRTHYTNAATWNSTFWHGGFILGNAVGGLLCVFGMPLAYSVVLGVITMSLVFVSFIGDKPLPEKEKAESIWESLGVGIRFVFSNKIILGALSLDLFAVLFGGAVAMLPAFADKILHVGSFEFGCLKAAPAAGAVLTAFLLAYIPLKKNAGKTLLFSITGFGIATILFAISTNLYLSLFLLLLTGAFDNVSVVVRHSILQLMTPDTMRGRVSAVNNIFIGSSNELGGFESGVTARLMGLVSSVVFGGVMTLLVVFTTARLSPAIRKLNLKEIE